VLGEGQYTLLEPAAQDGQHVFNRVITEYEDAAGVRGAATSEDQTYMVSSTQLPNPSFDTDTSSWTVFNGTLTRDTVVFDTAPASGRLTSNAGGYAYFESPRHTELRRNTEYQMVIRFRRNATLVNGISAGIYVFGAEGTNSFGTGSTGPFGSAHIANTDLNAYGTGSFVDVPIKFRTGNSGTAAVSIELEGPSSTILAYIDSITIRQKGSSVVSRRGFRRTALRPMTHRSTAATADAIAQLELNASQFPPFKGTIAVTGRIPLKGGGSMDAAHIPGRGIGENLLLKNLADPNSQALGRIGNIQSAVYDESKHQTLIGIDRDLHFISQLRDRLAINAR
jgi:hypothetical protein